jgi:hypothetical protein
MHIEIKSRFTGAVVLQGEYESLIDCLEKNRAENLSSIDLSGAQLGGIDLHGAKLCSADLQGANMTGAILDCADLRHANLDSTILAHASLCGAMLRWARITKTVFLGANLSGASLTNATMENALVIGAKGLDANGVDSANITNIPVISIIGSREPMYYRDGVASIGCWSFPIEHWDTHREEIMKTSPHSPEEINEYRIYIEAILEILRRLKHDAKGSNEGVV